MYNRKYTPDRISDLKENEIFVFGSNLAGSHGGGAAKLAYKRFGAIWGQGAGLQGQSYAIPTMHGGVDLIEPYVEGFMDYAFRHRELTFYVTRIGCGIAGFTPYEIAPLFLKVIDLPNVILPRDFVEVLHNHPRVKSVPMHTWDSNKDFLDKYKVLQEEMQNGNSDSYHKVKELRAYEYRNTIELVKHGYYITEGGKRVAITEGTKMMHNTVFYEREFLIDAPIVGKTVIEIVNDDCLSEGIRLKNKGHNPAILNMASRRNPGGGVTTGAGAQEETLFRRTDIFQSLYQYAPYAGQYGISLSCHQYPLDRNFGGIYTPNATVFRESEMQGYKLMDKPIQMSFITVAGMNRPDIDCNGMIAQHHVGPIKNKMRTILRIGLRHGHDSLVLGALGCGAFCNPPVHIAKLFHEVFEEPEFMNKYRLISFAILDDHNAYRSHNPEGNYKPFVDEFADIEKKKDQPSPDVLKALMMWKMGAGNSAKRFNGEDPMPVKTVVATKDSWSSKPMPERHTVIPVNVVIPDKAMEYIKYGHIPEAMEDHWFMYCDDNTIRYYRSWTGFCIYVAKYEKVNEGYRITELTVNRYPEQYNCNDDKHDIAMFMALLTEEYGGDASDFWNAAF